MGGKSIKGHVAAISKTFLRVVNLIVLAGAVATIVIMFVVSPSPSFPAGWGFILLGIVTIISAIFGTISSGQGGCFTTHLFFLFLSSIGLAAGCVLMLLKLRIVLNAVHNKLSYSDGRQLLRVEGALYFILFCSQIVILMLACLIQTCGFVDYYEDLEAITPANARKLAKQHAKEEAEAEKRRLKAELNAESVQERSERYSVFNKDPLYSDSESGL